MAVAEIVGASLMSDSDNSNRCAHEVITASDML